MVSRRLIVVFRCKWSQKAVDDKIASDEKRIHAGKIAADKRIAFVAQIHFQETERRAKAIAPRPNVRLVIVHAENERRGKLCIVFDYDYARRNRRNRT